MKGILYLFPTPIGENKSYNCMPPINESLLKTCECFIVENVRTVLSVLRKSGFTRDFDEIEFYELNEHTKFEAIGEFIKPLFEGKNVGLLSEAGLPCVADPGWQIVNLCHQNRIKVVPLVGASSLMLALMSSGLCGQNFAFVGYIPVKPYLRTSTIKTLERKAIQDGQVQIFIEAPYRNNRLIEDILECLHDETLLCIAADLMLPTEQIVTKPVSIWKKTKIDILKRPCVFLIGRQEF